MKIEQAWENDRDSFIRIPKVEFDELTLSRKFIEGPLTKGRSRLMQEYGPYSPDRWAFGELKGGKRVCMELV